MEMLFLSWFVCPEGLSSVYQIGVHGAGLSANSLLIFGAVLAIAGVGLGLGRVLDVGVVQEILDAEEDLLDRDGRPPILLLVQEGQADRARGVDVRVEQWWHELHLGRGGRVVILEDHLALVESAVPGGVLLARDPVFPNHQVQGAVGVLHGPGDEAEGMVLPPGFPLLAETRLCNAAHF